MTLANSPYVGTWKIDGKRLVQHTPDALVYLNGDTALPGCQKCHRRIDVQQFLTEVGVEAGTEPGGASANFSLTVPMHHTDSFARDAKFLLRPGLEVHIYYRGYFPTDGMFSALDKPTIQAEVQTGTTVVEEAQLTEEERKERELKLQQQREQEAKARQQQGRISAEYVNPPIFDPEKGLTRRDVNDWARRLNVTEDMLMAAIVVKSETERPDESITIAHTLFNRQATGQYRNPRNGDNSIWYIANKGNTYTAAQDVGSREYSTGRIPTGKDLDRRLALVEDTLRQRQRGETAEAVVNFVHSDTQEKEHAEWVAGGRKGTRYRSTAEVLKSWEKEGLSPVSLGYNPNRVIFLSSKYQRRRATPSAAAFFATQALGPYDPTAAPPLGTVAEPGKPYVLKQQVGDADPKQGPSLLDTLGLGDSGIDEVIAYPYYHVFHGVVTQVTFNYSGGFQNITVQCGSILHFWSYQQLSENASFLGARPTNSKLKMSLVGSNFSGKHPYQVLYELYSDVGGAAHGVGWALGSTTNQEALSFNGESLFSINLSYWEKRFKSRMNKLRLHGASGELFSAAQAAYLSRLSTTDLVNQIKNRHTLAQPASNDAKAFLNNSWALHVRTKAALDAFIQQQRSRPQGEAREESQIQELSEGELQGSSANPQVNIAEMQPFPLDLGKIGQFELFESTYVSKLDVAQKVMEVTGFEFYQDVDGDFVFKPPMYNLDTSSSRVYRIEDIDIISINFSEKEPEATYVTAKGSHFKNLQGTGLESEWGVRGQYIDYRLVAQFGWRPGSLDTTYFNDPKSLFFAAVNRLDIMNAGVNSASATIPLRPEMRPGYPVYIPYLDCYYYCPSFSHSFSVGGSCQTTLQLVAKRSKFFAPGVVTPGIEGIDAIDLSRPELPERPLQVMGQDGRPRLSGFPNVVMALDPYRLNPAFFLLGTDIDNLSDPETLQNLLDMAVEFGVIRFDDKTGFYTYEALDASSQPQNVYFSLQAPGNNPDPRLPREGAKVIDLLTVGESYTQLTATRAKEKDALQTQLIEVRSEIQRNENILQDARPNVQPGEKEIARALLYGAPAGSTPTPQAQTDAGQPGSNPSGQQAQSIKDQEVRTGLYDQRSDLEKQLSDLNNSTTNDKLNAQINGLPELIQLIERTGSKLRISGRQEVPDLESTVNLLDLLSEKKAVFSNGQQPGYYRYYSASHPKKEMQGQPLIRQTREPKTPAGGENAKGAPILDPVYQNATVLGYRPAPTSIFPGGERPESELAEDQPVTWGIRIQTSDVTKYPKGIVTPTHLIRELSFARHESKLRRPLSNTNRTEIPLVSTGVTEALNGVFEQQSNNLPDKAASISSFFKEIWTANATYLKDARDVAALAVQGQETVPDITPPEFPLSVLLNGLDVESIVALESFFGAMDYSGTSSSLEDLTAPDPQAQAVQAMTSNSPQTFMQMAGVSLGLALSVDVQQVRGDWISRIEVKNPENREKIIATFDSTLSAKLGVKSVPNDKVKKKEDFSLETVFESPVFPVSDEKGYHVYGTYRYGRGISVEPNGVFDVLHKQDPVSMLSRPLVENIIRVLVDGQADVTVFVEEVTPNGQIKRVPRTPQGEGAARLQSALSLLEQAALQELRNKNVTDKDLLDLGLATRTDNPSVIQLSLQNFYANKKESLMKVPLLNAAYSLADLTEVSSGYVCSCKAAEAGVLLEAFGQAGFVSVDPTAASSEALESPDKLTQWLGQRVAEAVPPWALQQQALRGTVLDRRGTNIIDTFNDLRNFSASDAITQAERSFNTSVGRFNQAVENLGDEEA
jgi:hypothetical protein